MIFILFTILKRGIWVSFSRLSSVTNAIFFFLLWDVVAVFVENVVYTSVVVFSLQLVNLSNTNKFSQLM